MTGWGVLPRLCGLLCPGHGAAGAGDMKHQQRSLFSPAETRQGRPSRTGDLWTPTPRCTPNGAQGVAPHQHLHSRGSLGLHPCPRWAARAPRLLCWGTEEAEQGARRVTPLGRESSVCPAGCTLAGPLPPRWCGFIVMGGRLGLGFSHLPRKLWNECSVSGTVGPTRPKLCISSPYFTSEGQSNKVMTEIV